MTGSRRQVLATMVGATFQADRRLAVAAPMLTVVAQLAAPLTALGVKLAVDAALSHDRQGAVFAALLSASVVALLYVLSLLASRVTRTLDDRLGLFLDEQLISAATAFPGLEHFETSSMLDRFTLLRADRGYLLSGAGLLIGMLGTAARLAGTLVLLASVSPLLLAVPLLMLPSLAIVRVRSRIANAVELEVAPRLRLSESLFSIATDPAAGKEARAYRIEGMLAERWDRVQHEIDHLRNRAMLRTASLATLAWGLFGVGFVGGTVLAVNRAVAGEASVGDVIMTLYLIGQIQAETGVISATIANLGRMTAAGERLLTVQALTRSRTGSSGPQKPSPPRLHDGIQLRGVDFTYPNAVSPAGHRSRPAGGHHRRARGRERSRKIHAGEAPLPALRGAGRRRHRRRLVPRGLGPEGLALGHRRLLPGLRPLRDDRPGSRGAR